MALENMLGGRTFPASEMVRLATSMLHRWTGQFELKTVDEDVISVVVVTEGGVVTSVKFDGVEVRLGELEAIMITMMHFMLGAHGAGDGSDYVNELSAVLMAAIQGALPVRA